MKAIKRNDLRKYLPESRINPSDWKTGKTVEEINKIKSAGGFLDLTAVAGTPAVIPLVWLTTAMCWNGEIFDAGANMLCRQRRRQDPCAEVHVG